MEEEEGEGVEVEEEVVTIQRPMRLPRIAKVQGGGNREYVLNVLLGYNFFFEIDQARRRK